MGKKGDKQTNASSESAQRLEQSLFGLGDIRTRKMFGGHGVFEEDTMFALIDSGGVIFFKANEANLPQFEAAGSSKHARMPYFSVPDTVLADDGLLREWAQISIAISKKGK